MSKKAINKIRVDLKELANFLNSYSITCVHDGHNADGRYAWDISASKNTLTLQMLFAKDIKFSGEVMIWWTEGSKIMIEDKNHAVEFLVTQFLNNIEKRISCLK